MAGFHQSESTPEEQRDPTVERFNAVLGLVLFAVYFAGYLAYMLINTFWPSMMDEVPFGGINLAVSSGMTLIIGAMVLALLYAVLCRRPKRGQA